MIKVHAPAQENPQQPDLVLLHGWCMSARIWDRLLPQLQAFCNPWCVDLPDHGSSPAGPWPQDSARIVAAINTQVPADAVWLGWSLAGLLVLAAAATQPLRGIVLLAANPKFVQDADWPGMPAAHFGQFRSGFAADPEATLIGFQKLQSGQRPLPPAAQEALLAALTPLRTDRLAGLLQALDYLRDGDARQILPEITCPSLILGGSADRLVPAQALQCTAKALIHSRLTQSRLPQPRLKLLPDAGHALMLEQPDAVTQCLREFLHGL